MLRQPDRISMPVWQALASTTPDRALAELRRPRPLGSVLGEIMRTFPFNRSFQEFEKMGIEATTDMRFVGQEFDFHRHARLRSAKKESWAKHAAGRQLIHDGHAATSRRKSAGKEIGLNFDRRLVFAAQTFKSARDEFADFVFAGDANQLWGVEFRKV
jgi:hypothetical protein